MSLKRPQPTPQASTPLQTSKSGNPSPDSRPRKGRTLDSLSTGQTPSSASSSDFEPAMTPAEKARLEWNAIVEADLSRQQMTGPGFTAMSERQARQDILQTPGYDIHIAAARTFWDEAEGHHRKLIKAIQTEEARTGRSVSLTDPIAKEHLAQWQTSSEQAARHLQAAHPMAHRVSLAIGTPTAFDSYTPDRAGRKQYAHLHDDERGVTFGQGGRTFDSAVEMLVKNSIHNIHQHADRTQFQDADAKHRALFPELPYARQKQLKTGREKATFIAQHVSCGWIPQPYGHHVEVFKSPIGGLVRTTHGAVWEVHRVDPEFFEKYGCQERPDDDYTPGGETP